MKHVDVTNAALPADTRARLQRILGSSVTATWAVRGGYTLALRWLVALADGRRVGVKQAIDDAVVPRLRREHSVCQHLSGKWCAEVVGFEDGDQPLLILEDLSRCVWPPPWNTQRVEGVRAALRDIAIHPPPPGLDRASSFGFAEDGWPR